MIEFHDVSKTFAGRPAASHLNLHFAEGAFSVLIGTSGSGKSTTLKMINRLVEHDSGTIRFAGEEIRSLPVLELRRRMGYAIQSIGLFPHWTVAQNIATVLQLEKWSRAKINERVDELMALLGLDASLRDRYPHQLSGGQQQRVGVARALADRLVLMDHGEVVQQGTPLELLTAPANDFVREFFGRSELGVRLLSLRTVRDYMRPQEAQIGGEPLHDAMSLRDALSAFVARQCEVLPVADGQGTPCGTIHFRDLLAGEVTSEVGT
ncbi:ABC transporter ATP-binding protein [Enterobacter hormaechei]|nr:ABC transporter ATP-binding protein [Enterobacter hormaechei]